MVQQLLRNTLTKRSGRIRRRRPVSQQQSVAHSLPQPESQVPQLGSQQAVQPLVHSLPQPAVQPLVQPLVQPATSTVPLTGWASTIATAVVQGEHVAAQGVQLVSQVVVVVQQVVLQH